MFGNLPNSEALEILKRLPASAETDALTVTFFERLAASGEWDLIKRAVAELPETPGVLGGISHACIEWARIDSRGLTEWSLQVSSVPLLNHIGLGIDNFIIRQPAEEAISNVRTLLSEPLNPILAQRICERGVKTLVASGNAAAAAEWLLALDPADANTADEYFVSNAGVSTGQQFLQQLYARGDYDRADRALQRFMDSVASQAPRNAAEWALSIQDESAREKALPTVLLSWGIRDPSAARDWVNGLPSSGQREKWLTFLSRIHK